MSIWLWDHRIFPFIPLLPFTNNCFAHAWRQTWARNFIKPPSDFPPSSSLLPLSPLTQSIAAFSQAHYHHSNCTVVHFVPPGASFQHTYTPNHSLILVFWFNCTCSVCALKRLDVWGFTEILSTVYPHVCFPQYENVVREIKQWLKLEIRWNFGPCAF